MVLSQNWLVGITGGIAAYKTPEIIRILQQNGAQVRVVLSSGAENFVTKMTLQAITGHPVYDQLFDTQFEAAMGHIALAKWADHILIAPLSANRLAALAHGFADDLLTTLTLASSAPLWLAPAMNQQMWAQAAVQSNVNLVQERGANILGPEYGIQACKDIGWGRMQEPQAMVADIIQRLKENQPSQNMNSGLLKGLRILITAGPTREYLDPVRFMSNKSSGKMGYAIAKVAVKMGAEVTLVSGPVNLPPPPCTKHIYTESAQEMHDKVLALSDQIDIAIGCAAVADFRFEEKYNQKIKKEHNENPITMTMVKNPDIMQALGQIEKGPFCVGFAAETNNTIEHARAKLIGKKLDMIALNDVSRADIGFDSDDNQLLLLSASEQTLIPKAPKEQVAFQLLEKIREGYDAKNKIKSN